MTYDINETHDPKVRSWVMTANLLDADFPLQNLPYGLFEHEASEGLSIGVAIGDQILDLTSAAEEEYFNDTEIDEVLSSADTNALMELSLERRMALRRQVFEWLREDSPHIDEIQDFLVPMQSATMHVPCFIGDYTDFYASVFHATNVGSMFRPDNPLLPNYKWVPIGYHGRASSIVVSGTPVIRPNGQTRVEADAAPRFGPTKRLDYELEVGCFIGQRNNAGVPIAIDEAERHMFGLCLVNDWSARDIQAWEYQPLGPFLAKNFATTVSPWVVTMEALAPFRAPAFRRPDGDPQPLGYLLGENDQRQGGIDLTVEAYLSTRKMREQGVPPQRLSRGSLRDMYWTFAQMVAHHSSNGCNLVEGDLLASGTVSGPCKDSRGCLLELTWKGSEPIQLPGGETRTFLDDGDEVVLRGYCEAEGYVRIGLGECRGVVIG